MKRLSRIQAEQKISELEISNEQLIADAKIANEEHDTSTKLLKTEVENLNLEVKQKQAQLDSKELKRLASAYKEQEGIYNKESLVWFVRLEWIAGALLISTAISIWLSSDKVWYDKFEYYVIDLIFLSAVWFCGSQYANLIKLRNDYANRKTIAQSFHNILNNLAEDEDIKDKFIEKATDVLCAASFAVEQEPVLSKKLVRDTAEIVKAVRG